jgi:hypothetical protein
MQLPDDSGASNPDVDAHPDIEVNVPGRNRNTADWTHGLRTVTVLPDDADETELLIYDQGRPTAWIQSSAQADIAKAYGPVPPSEPEDDTDTDR